MIEFAFGVSVMPNVGIQQTVKKLRFFDGPLE